MTEAIIVHFFQTAHKKHIKSRNECYVGQKSLYGSNVVDIHSLLSDPFHMIAYIAANPKKNSLQTHNEPQDESNMFPNLLIRTS